MSQPSILQLKDLAAETASQNGFELCSLQLLTHQAPITMQVQIRRIEGEDVSLEDCSIFSGSMGEALEASALLQDNYVLEISSPGIGEELITDRDFKTFQGFPIEVTFKNVTNNEIFSSGLLHKRCNDFVHLNIKGKITRIPRNEVLGVRLTNPKR